MNRNRKNRDDSYYASSRRNMHSVGNGRTYRGPAGNDMYEEGFQSYDDGYDDNYPSPAYSMGSGNFNAGRKVYHDEGNMFKPDSYDREDDNFHDDSDRYQEDARYDHNYSDNFPELEEGEDMYGQPIGRYNRNYLDTRNRENKVVRHWNKNPQNNKTGKNDHRRDDNPEGASGTDWYGYYNRAYFGAHNNDYEDRQENSSPRENYRGTLRRKRPYL